MLMLQTVCGFIKGNLISKNIGYINTCKKEKNRIRKLYILYVKDNRHRH